MQAALAQLEQAAHSDVNVLLLGETGVGKELFARTLYRNSHRASRPFVAVDCASLPETLVESHLFGHARGAFTGAERASEGLLRAAHQGTLFLDEVGDLPQGIQRAFLRALELRRFRPVGEVREVESDFRLVAATNQDLEAMSEDGRFRKDLLYRLQGMTIVIPPLRRRRDEIPLLARQAVIRCCRRNGMEEKELSPLLPLRRVVVYPASRRFLSYQSLTRKQLVLGRYPVEDAAPVTALLDEGSERIRTVSYGELGAYLAHCRGALRHPPGTALLCVPYPCLTYVQEICLGLACGDTLLPMESFEPKDFIKTVSGRPVDSVYLTPSIINAVSMDSRFLIGNFSRLRAHCPHGG